METDLFYLQCSTEYADFIMANGDRPVGNGDMLTELMEEGYLFEEFLEKINVR